MCQSLGENKLMNIYLSCFLALKSSLDIVRSTMEDVMTVCVRIRMDFFLYSASSRGRVDLFTLL